MVAPLIGITTSVTVDKIPERAYVNGTYIRAVQAAGGIPVLLTPHFTPDVQAALWSRLDGLVLTGGGDIEPARFGEAPHATVDEVSPARDALELGLTLRAVNERCRCSRSAAASRSSTWRWAARSCRTFQANGRTR